MEEDQKVIQKNLRRSPSRIDSIHVSLVVLHENFPPDTNKRERERERLGPVIGPGEGWSRNGGRSDGSRQERHGEAQEEEERHGQLNEYAAAAALLLNFCIYMYMYIWRERQEERDILTVF